MRILHLLSDPTRWEWFGAGDGAMSKPLPRSASQDNSPQRMLFEIGLVLAAPLLLAGLIEVLFGP